ncbi:lachesin-like, partial [Musca vetustissima]|uniref:lachesin-like n=1 Tax=Musca vetustissima TaxID=27455 RepID=UPI002AB77446
MSVFTVNSLNLPSQSLDYKVMAQNYRHLQNLPVKSYSNAVPMLLIGLNHFDLGIHNKVREGSPYEPVAIGYLDVVIPPDFVTEDTSSDVIVPEGSAVRLTCRARGYPEPIVTWRREDGNEIVLKDSVGTKTLVSSYRGEVLKLAKISRNEMGSYLCIASNGVPPSVSKRISLSIH